jgi:hypothetical protein
MADAIQVITWDGTSFIFSLFCMSCIIHLWPLVAVMWTCSAVTWNCF